ncbi:MAG: thioredoxin-like domain-containing protein [Thermogutta sp.]
MQQSIIGSEQWGQRRGELSQLATAGIRGWFSFASVLVLSAYLFSTKEAFTVEQPPFALRRPVPDLPENLEWLNTSGPLTWRDLRGKFVLIDFWTYCCINCMHVIPELKKLEAKYPQELIVIGVHSAKFVEEKDSQNIIQAILRHGIEHPVINDAEMVVWRRFGVNAWPTLVLIDPEGFIVWAQSGETTFEALDAILAPAIAFYQKRGLLDRSPVFFSPVTPRATRTSLRFPGKVIADEKAQRLFIADSGHHRIVVTRFDGEVLAVIGNGEPGLRDGSWNEARFNSPQGMALIADRLLVADTENHAIREVDFDQKTVRTVAGTGVQRRRPPVMRMGVPLETELSSPWDLCAVGDWVYIAMAGCHQIWRMDAKLTRIGPYAGNGREDIVDGQLLPSSPYVLGFASFAQPSGLATDGEWLYVADSEGSSIRAVPLDPRGEVRTIVGTSRLLASRLFTFGDRDGPPDQVLLQHPIGICWANGFLYLADTYNNKIKRIDPRTGTTLTVAGDRQPGQSDEPPRFDEPAGIAAAGNVLFVADTNNHAIRVLRLQPNMGVSTLALTGLEPPKGREKSSPSTADQVVFQQEPVAKVRPGAPLRLRILLEFSAGFGLNPSVPTDVIVQPIRNGNTGVKDSDTRGQGGRQVFRLTPRSEQLEVSLAGLTSEVTALRIVCTYYWCEKSGRGLCRIGNVGWVVPLQWADDGIDIIVVSHQVKVDS